MDRFLHKRQEPGLSQAQPQGAASGGTGPHAAGNTSESSLALQRAERACTGTEPGVLEGQPERAAGEASEGSCAL